MQNKSKNSKVNKKFIILIFNTLQLLPKHSIKLKSKILTNIFSK